MSKSDGERWPASSATTWNPTADIQQQVLRPTLDPSIDATFPTNTNPPWNITHRGTSMISYVFHMLAAGSVCDLDSAGNKPWYLEGWTYTFAAYGGNLAMTWRLLAILPHYCVFLAVCLARIALRCAMVSSPTFKKMICNKSAAPTRQRNFACRVVLPECRQTGEKTFSFNQTIGLGGCSAGFASTVCLACP